jgi:prepilin-type N-terminal cleavage/methylation domain-containing protein
LERGCSNSGGEAFGIKPEASTGFTVIELLVVVAIISLLMSIMLPVLVKVRRRAIAAMCVQNQRQVVSGVNLFALDHDNRYPESVATIGWGDNWNWQEPTMMTAYNELSPGLHRSMGAYLHSYIEDAGVMCCPSAPGRYKYLQQSWDDGDEWDNPDTGPMPDPVKGSYCFYWSYTGLLEDGLFQGPRNAFGDRGRSKLVVSDYFGYDCWRSPGAYGASERFKGAQVTEGTYVSSAYWSRAASDQFNLGTFEIILYAGYADGHVESYSGSEVATMKVIMDVASNEPYDYGPGDFYLPLNGLR